MFRGARAARPIEPPWATLHIHSSGVESNDVFFWISESLSASTLKSVSTPSSGFSFGADWNASRRFFCTNLLKEWAVENSFSDIFMGITPVESTASNRTEVVSFALFITQSGR